MAAAPAAARVGVPTTAFITIKVLYKVFCCVATVLGGPPDDLGGGQRMTYLMKVDLNRCRLRLVFMFPSQPSQCVLVADYIAVPTS